LAHGHSGAPHHRPRLLTPASSPRRGARPAPPVEQPDHVTRAYGELRQTIVWGQLPPGSRISERIVAERLGLSRTPVRSALHRLEQEGFVASVGQGRERRLIVAPLTMHDGQEVYALVGHLEGLAARLAAALPAPRRKTLVERLRDVNGRLAEQARIHGDPAHFFDLDIEFHRTYVEGVVGPRLLALHRAIKPQSERYTRLYVSVFINQVATSVREHETITRSIARGDRDGAQRAAETNWHNAAERLATVIAQHGERGTWESWGTESAPASEPSTQRARIRRKAAVPAKARR
jgi:DNA-binding GntR family transcriptional regulator